MPRKVTIIALLLGLAGCTPSLTVTDAPRIPSSPRHDQSLAAASAWATDIENVAGAIGLGHILLMGESLVQRPENYCNEGNRLAESGEFRLALREKSKAIYLSSRIGNDVLTAHCAAGIALIYDYMGDDGRASAWSDEALTVLAKATPVYGDTRVAYVRAMAFKVRADVALRGSGGRTVAKQHMDAALVAAGQHPALLPWLQLGMANLQKSEQPLQAAVLFREVIAKGSDADRDIARRELGLLLLDSDINQATQLFYDLETDARRNGNSYSLSWALRGLALSAQKRGQIQEALDNYRRAVLVANDVRQWFQSEELRSGTFGTLQTIFTEAVTLLMHEQEPREAFEIAEQARARSLRELMRDASAAPIEGQVGARVVQALPPDTTMVSYYVTNDQLFIWKITRERFDSIAVPVNRVKIRNAAKSPALIFNLPTTSDRQEMARREAAVEADASTLTDYLIQPLGLAESGDLIIIPHSVLHAVPFAMLGKHHRLIEQHVISYAPAAAVWLQAKARARPQQGMLILGDPTTPDPADQLGGTAMEVQRVSALIQPSAPLVGPAATPAAFIQNASRYGVLHIAAHAVTDVADPRSSALLLAGKSEQDSRLEARQVQRLTLPGAALVTMSACYTIGGVIAQGDEIYSLTSAFMAAGARNVLTTLWQVADVATADLMVDFYRHVSAGEDYPQALRQAQLAMMSNPETRSPFFWAPFAVIGAGKP